MNVHLKEVELIGKLADLKLDHYQNSLVLSAMLELLVEKGILTRCEIEAKAKLLDQVSPDPNCPIP